MFQYEDHIFMCRYFHFKDKTSWDRHICIMRRLMRRHIYIKATTRFFSCRAISYTCGISSSINCMQFKTYLHFCMTPRYIKYWKSYFMTFQCVEFEKQTLLWRHNGRNGVSNHQSHDSLLNCLFRRRSKKTSKLRVTGLCAGNSPGTGEFPAQMTSNAENVSIWWRYHMRCWWGDIVFQLKPMAAEVSTFKCIICIHNFIATCMTGYSSKIYHDTTPSSAFSTDIWNETWQIDCLFNSLSKLTINKTSKLHITDHLWGGLVI